MTLTTPSNRPLRIALLLECDEPGGAELLVLDLAIELRRRGHKVLFVGPQVGTGWLGSKFDAEGFERATFSIRSPFDWKLVRDLMRLFREHDIDVVHSHEFTMSVYCAAASSLLDIPHVTTMHGNMKMTKVWRRRAALRWAFRRADSTIAVSEATRRELARDLGIGADRLAVIRNGVPRKVGRRAETRAALGISDDEWVVFASGRVEPRKGHLLLAQAMAQMEQGAGGRPWRMIVAGLFMADEPDKILSWTRAHGIENRVHLLGQREDIPDLLAACDVFAMPSLAEGLPLALLEAMNARRPIVASRTHGIPEAIDDEVHGLLVPPGEVAPLAAALERLRSDTSLGERLVANAGVRADEWFTLEAMTDGYMREFRDAIARRRRHSGGVGIA